MTVLIKPGRAEGRVLAPPSKSAAHRLLISAALSEGESRVCGVSDCEDVLATLDSMRALGIECEREGDTVIVKQGGLSNVGAKAHLYCRESGSTLRFFIPIALLTGKEIVFEGTESLMRRPLDVYSDIADEYGLEFVKEANSVTVKGSIRAGDYRVKGNISSQFISGLLFALPLADGDSRIIISPPVESSSYINLTVRALSEFGVVTEWQDENTLFIKGNQKYRAHTARVEGDWSNAAFLSAFNLFDGDVTVDGLLHDSLQGDKVYLKYFSMLAEGAPTLDITDCPDLGPVLFAIAGAKNGARFEGTRRLRIKESDRVATMAEELSKFGIISKINDDSVEIIADNFHAPSECLFGHNDHRIVMALSLLLTLTGGCMTGAQAVGKSFPDFFEKLSMLGIDITESEN